jgi:hypothetical protein
MSNLTKPELLARVTELESEIEELKTDPAYKRRQDRIAGEEARRRMREAQKQSEAEAAERARLKAEETHRQITDALDSGEGVRVATAPGINYVDAGEHVVPDSWVGDGEPYRTTLTIRQHVAYLWPSDVFAEMLDDDERLAGALTAGRLTIEPIPGDVLAAAMTDKRNVTAGDGRVVPR